MGNLMSLQSHIKAEISRLNELANEVESNARSFLVLDQILELKQMREQEIDLQHLGILFVLDKGLKGYFNVDDFVGLGELCLRRLEKWKESNFQQQLQAHCTLQMWHVVCGRDGGHIFSAWFCKMLSASTAYQEQLEAARKERERAQYSDDEDDSADDDSRRKKRHGVDKWINDACLKTLYKLLNLGEVYGLTYSSFLSLCQRASEEKKLRSSDDDYELIPMPVLREFSLDFIRGFTRLMHRLGFDRETALQLND